MKMIKTIRQWINENTVPIVVISCAFAVHIYVVYASALALLVFYGIKKGRFSIDIGDLFIFLAMTTWKAFAGQGISSVIITGFGSLLVYQAGKMILSCGDTERVRLTEFAVITLASCIFIKGIVNYSYLLRDPDAVLKEKWPNWRGEVLVRTHYEFFLIIMGSLIAYFLIATIVKSGYYVFGILCSLLAVSMGVYSRGRLAFLCALLTLVAIIFAYLIEKGIYKSRAFIVTVALMIVCGIASVLVYSYNIGGFRDAYAKSWWSGSGGIIHNTRFSLQAESIRQLKDYPFGRNNTILTEYDGDQKTPYAHNTWLDIGRQGGIIPLILTLCFSVYNIVCMVHIWLKDKNMYKYALLSAFIGITLYNCAEPAFVSDPMFWAVEIYLGGLLTGKRCLSQ